MTIRCCMPTSSPGHCHFVVLIPPRQSTIDAEDWPRCVTHEVLVRTQQQAIALVRAHHDYGYTEADYIRVDGLTLDEVM